MKQQSIFSLSAWLALAISVCFGVTHAGAQGTGLTGKYYDTATFTTLKTTWQVVLPASLSCFETC